jgi:toxin ParE1/3/4
MAIIWRRSALADLEALREFIAHDNPRAAARISATIQTAVERLAAYPNLGRAGRVEGARELIITEAPCIVAYRVVEDQIRILSVLHASRQWPRRFR